MRFLLAFIGAVLLPVSALAQTYGFGLLPAPVEKYGAIPEAFQPLIGSQLPANVDLSIDMPPPDSQGNQRSCVAWAVAYALKTYQERRERNWSLRTTAGPIDASRVFSPSFIYNQIMQGADRGSNFGDAFHVLTTQGAAPLSAMPYSSPYEPVSDAAREAAAPYKVDTFRRLSTGDTTELKNQLAAGFPILIAGRVYNQFINLPPNGVWSYASGQYDRHAMVLVGYDDQRQAFKVMNSWGQDWSSGGFGWISYNLFPQVIDEAYIVVDLQGADSTTNVPDDVWQPPAVTAEQASIVIDNIDPNFYDPALGVGMRMTGRITIPAGVRGVAQIVIPLEFQNGVQVLTSDPRFRLPSGQAAFGTPPRELSGSGLTDTWYAFIRYCSLDVPMTKLCIPYPSPPSVAPAVSLMRTAPVLFIDNFGVARGNVTDFFVSL